MTLFYDFGKFCKKKCLTDLVKFFILASMIFCVVGCNLDTVTEEKNTTGTIQKNTTGTIQGTVIYDNATVSDYSGIQVSLFSSNGLMASNNCISRTIVTKSRSLESVGITNSKGEYIFENVPEGVYTIYASSNSSTQKAVATNVVVRASETVTPDVLGLTATGSLSGQVYIDSRTDGVLGLDVFIPGTSFIAKVDEDGYFEISNIPISTGYELYIQKGEKVLQLYDSEEIDFAFYYSVGLGTSYLNSAELETVSFKWLGSFWETPENPELNNAYFNYNDGCSYIWNGYYWDLLAKSGEDGEDGENGLAGKSINWRGSYTSSDNISSPQYLDVYYNSTDCCSYIYDKWGRWELLAKGGRFINWVGSYSSSSEINNPQYLDAYYDITDGCSYIYDGHYWEVLAASGRDGEDGKSGKSINWIGSYTSSDNISYPQYLDAYFNTTDGCSYIWNGYYWDLLAKSGNDGIDGADGNDGQDGKSINWRGSFSSANEINNPQHLDAYRNSTDGCSYIYISEGVYTPRWQLLASKGEDGASINWRGSYASSNQISYPQKLDAYYNTIDGCSYIYNGSRWELLAQKGDTGETGMSIKWKGNCSDLSTISNPQVLDAYYNITDGCSYIYDGNTWHLLARKGTDGATSSGDGSIRWLGSFVNFNEVPNPDAMDAFFNESTGCSYIYNGTKWVLLAQAGLNGISINWLGSYANTNFIHEPKYLDAYWNTTENCAYIYDGEKWTVLAKGPASGGSGSTDPTIGTEAGANIVGTTLVSWENPQGVIRIPNGVTDIAEGVFYNKDDITRVIIPSSVVSIGKEAFYDCYNLTSVEFLGPGLKIIGESAFAGCENLANIVLPNTLTTIGIAAFMYCKNITTVNIPNSVVTIGNDAYRYCSMLRTLTIGSGVTNLEEYIFGDCDTLTSVTIPDNVLRISVRLFVECDSLSEVHASGTWSDNEGNSNKVITVEDLKRSDYMAGYSDITWTRDTN